jgi:hypothetical protein
VFNACLAASIALHRQVVKLFAVLLAAVLTHVRKLHLESLGGELLNSGKRKGRLGRLFSFWNRVN